MPHHEVNFLGRYRGLFNPDSGKVERVERRDGRRWTCLWFGKSIRSVEVNFVIRQTERRFLPTA